MNNVNYLQIVPQTWQERYDMYMKCSKEELASMMAERDKYMSPESCKECQKEIDSSVNFSCTTYKGDSYSYSTSTDDVR